MNGALVLAADGHRENGRWQYKAVNSHDLGNSLAEYVRKSGVVLDFASDLIPADPAGVKVPCEWSDNRARHLLPGFD